MTIWKFPLRITDENAVRMPTGARILCVQVQNDSVYLWAVCDPETPEEVRKIVIIGTGHSVDAWRDEYAYIGTVQTGPLVWHVFDAGVR